MGAFDMREPKHPPPKPLDNELELVAARVADKSLALIGELYKKIDAKLATIEEKVDHLSGGVENGFDATASELVDLRNEVYKLRDTSLRVIKKLEHLEKAK